MGGGIGTIELNDGTTFRFDSDVVIEEMFSHFYATLMAVYQQEKRPDPPAFIYAIANARDREQAFRTVFPEGDAFFLLDREALLERGEVATRRISASEKMPGEQ